MASFGFTMYGDASEHRRVQKSRQTIGYARTGPYNRGRARGVPHSLQSRLGFQSGNVQRASQLSRRDLRLTKLGLTTKKSAQSQSNFDLRQKLHPKASSGKPQQTRDVTQKIVGSTFAKAIEETVFGGGKARGGVVVPPLITEPLSPVRSGIKVTIEGLGKPRAQEQLHVDRRRLPSPRQREPIVDYEAMGRETEQRRQKALGRREQDPPLPPPKRSRSPLPPLVYEEIEPVAPISPPMRSRSAHHVRAVPRQPQPSYAGLKTGTKLIVSNLQSSVSYEDILELFSDVGDLASANFIAEGIAEIVYSSPDDADAAFKKYHLRKLDGQPMMIRVGLAGNQSRARKEIGQSPPSSFSVQYKMTH